MRALILATGYRKELEPLVSYRPSPLLHIADKPIIFHVIEALISQGVKEVDCILHHFPEQIEQRLGKGERWGIKIHYHLIKKHDYPFPMMKTISKHWNDDPILIAQGDLLPLTIDMKKGAPVLFFHKETWTGWGIIHKKCLDKTFNETTPETFPQLIGKYQARNVDSILSAQSLSDLNRGNQEQISKPKPNILFPTTAHQVEPGIWISRGAVIEPGAMILPPVFIGDHSHIRSGATIGPNTVIERHALIDNQSRIQHSLVCRDSYIGENLEISECIVDRNSLINLEHGTALNIREQFILSDTSLPSFGNYLTEWMERGIALILCILLAPVYLFLRMTSDHKELQVVNLPTTENLSEWRTFSLFFFSSRSFFQRLPHLWEIVKGNLHFIGVAPRTPDELELMARDRKMLFLQSKNGLITLSQLDHGKDATEDEQYASEAYYAVHMGFIFDCKIFLRWLIIKLKEAARLSE